MKSGLPHIIKILLAVCTVNFLCGGSFAQSSENPSDNKSTGNPVHLWNSLIITSINNPALAGLERKHVVFFDYDNPWFRSYEDMPPQNLNAGYDLRIKTFKGKYKLGIGAYYSGSFGDLMSAQKMGIVNSFAIQFRNKSELSIGLSFLAINLSKIDYSNARFGNQFDGTGFNPSLSGTESLADDRLMKYGPLNFGVWYNAKNFFVGLSALNLTMSNSSFFEGGEVRSPVIFLANTGYHFNINHKFLVTPSMQYKLDALFVKAGENGSFHSAEPRITFSFSKNRFLFGAYYLNDEIFFLAGANLFQHWLINLDAGWFVNDAVKVSSGPEIKVKTRVHF